MRREFNMPEPDEDFLDRLPYPWETIEDNGNQWFVIRNWEVPSGYKQMTVDVALKIEPNYPDTQIDMAYFHPHLELTSGGSINQTGSRQTINGQTWQRWSRHRSASNPWRPGVDCLETHLVCVQSWLEREVK